ncbi:MAG: hypothetical protein WD669_09145 [Pirellulales bacterium]
MPTENISGSTWITLSKNEALIAALAPYVAAPDPKADPPQAPILWTDQRSSLFDLFKVLK